MTATFSVTGRCRSSAPGCAQTWLALLAAIALWVATRSSLFGCDLCGIYSAGQARGEIGKRLFAGLEKQFTHYGTFQYEGHETPNPADEYLDSSITQLLPGYNVTERFGLQL